MAVDVSDLVTSLTDWADQNANYALLVLRDELKDVVPYGIDAEGDTYTPPRTGPHLRDTEEVVIENYGGVGEWRTQLAYTADYASYTDTGSDAHPVDAAEGGRLVFYWPKVGKVVFAKHVEIPAQPGTRWWSDRVSIDAWAIYLQNAFDEGDVNQ